MGSRYLKGVLSGNHNKIFRVETKVYHILHRKFVIKDTPIIINNFNRLGYLKSQIEWLLSCGHHNIHIIDNASTFPPLIKYYKRVKATVYRLDRNLGHEAFWRTHLWQRFSKYYYVLTDPDVLPSAYTPTDFMEYFYDILHRFPETKKVGFGLKIDDLPDHYPKKKQVIAWEQQNLLIEAAPNLYKANIDTTFALYRPGAFLQCWNETLRTGHPYELKHMPWYENSATPDDEARFFIENANKSSSWYQTLAGNDRRYE